MEIGFKDLLEDIRRSLDRLNETLLNHDERIRKTELEIVTIKTRHQEKMVREKRLWLLLCTACGVLGGVIGNLL